MVKKFVICLLLGLVAGPLSAAENNNNQAEQVAYVKSLLYGGDTLTADFQERDKLPEHVARPERRRWRSLGSPARTYHHVKVPEGYDPVRWKRSRIIAVALKYIGLPYRHHHTPGWYSKRLMKNGQPEGCGLDCSNFSAWVYNYGLGIKFTPAIHDQADGSKAPGRRLSKDEPLEMGDLLFIHRSKYPDKISHVVIYIDKDHIIDESGPVAVRAFDGWRLQQFDHARRIIE